MRKYFLLLAAAVAAIACGPKVQEPSAEEFAPYIKAYTGGIVTSDAMLRIELAQEADAFPEEGLFSLKPSVKGTVKWDGPAAVNFIPEEALKEGKNYRVQFALGKVLEGAPDKFDFGLSVKGLSNEDGVEGEEPDNGKPFRVVKITKKESVIEAELSQAPANALVKGMVELEGVTRSYVQVQGNTLLVHFEGADGDIALTLDKGLKDAQGESLEEDFHRIFAEEDLKPAVEFPFEGNILPDRQNLILPFRAVNLSAVEVRVIKIYENNILMFLQDGNLASGNALRRNGRLIYKADIPLDRSKDLHRWNTHSIDLGGMFRQEPGALYRIRLCFRQDQSLYGGKPVPAALTNPGAGKPSKADEAEWNVTESYYWDDFYDWETYDWDEADDPDKPSYYMDGDRFPAVQLIASDLGLMADYAGGDQIWVAATDLITADPVSGAKVEAYDYQLQRVGEAKTDGKGLACLKLSRKPFAVIAKAGGSSAYLKLAEGWQRSTSRFDVGGEVLKEGLKAFIYGERGVWRPGDTLHVSAIVADKNKSLPEAHPATLEVYTPEGTFYSKLVRKGTDGFYSFDVPTKAEDPTGYWNAYMKVGGSSFHKVLHIETVKPNRLKINTSYPAILEGGQNAYLPVDASWLSGGVAGNMPVNAQITLRKTSANPIKGFEKYSFYAPSGDPGSLEGELFRGRLDASGRFSSQVQIPGVNGAPGPLQAFVVTSVEEPGGDESFTTETLLYSPFSSYVGIRVPEGDYLETDQDHRFQLAVVDCNGKRVKGHIVEYAVYKTGWSWWWDGDANSLDGYVNGSNVERILGGSLAVGDRDQSFSFRVDYPTWGRYMVLARDLTSGHISGATFTVDWPEYRGRASRQDPEALTQITLSTDKEAYQVGEKATVYIPAARGGRALISLENATGVLSREWVKTGDQDTRWSFSVTPEMAPNIYVQVSLLQPYGATVNDLPLRLYGVKRIKVENPDSHLEPVIQLPDVLHPEEPFTVKVSEKSGKPMTYTLAIVDEGLLDLTAFKTPDPWSRMYQWEALGVKTWDLYDQVIGAFNGSFSPLAAIGGDEAAMLNARKDNRFNPVVLYCAPKTLKKGTDEVKLQLPMYVGSVRVMLIAGHDGAYGKTEKTVPVQNPLMVVTTLPRVMGCGDQTSAAVNVFAMEDGVKEASITLKADGPISGGGTQKVSFNGKGDALLRFPLKASATLEGISHITISASGSGHKASETIALEVRNPQPEITTVEHFTLEKGQSYKAKGSSLQLASFPAVDVRAMYLNMRNYSYNCTEQLSARGLTFLHLMPILSEADAVEARNLIPGIINALYARQCPDGGFAYWSGGSSSTWISSMAGQFLTEAAKAGFDVNKSVLRAWRNYQQKISQVYRLAGTNFFSHLDEAYRLYTLAIAGEPYLSGMNRLREADEIGNQARWMLASAYAVSGKTALADKLLDGNAREFPEYEPYNLTYGTGLRDRLVAIDALALCDRPADAVSLATDLPVRSYSTQESAFAAMALGHLYAKTGGSAVKAKVDGQAYETEGGILSLPINKESTVVSQSEGEIYGTVLNVSRDALRKAVSNGIGIQVQYLDEKGAALSPARIKQGTRFTAKVKVTGNAIRSMENLALNLGIPAGWEIVNERMTGGAAAEDGYDYKDIRDDRVLWYFALPAGRSKTFSVQLRAAYEGTYALPAIQVEAMYEPAVNAAVPAGTAVVNAQ